MMYEWEKCPFSGAMDPACLDRELRGEPQIEPDGPVLGFTFVSSWRERVWRLISDLVTPAVVEAVVEDPPEFLVSDDLSWLNDVVSVIEDADVDMKEVLAERLTQEFAFVRAFHGTRTANLAPFYERGLRILRPEEIEDLARNLFVNDDRQANRLVESITDMDASSPTKGRAGALYFCASTDNLISRYGGAGHYLVHGSEYLYCLGIRTRTIAETQRILKGIGRPTLFCCDVPLRMLGPGALGEFAGTMLETLFTEVLEARIIDELPEGTQTGFSIRQDLPSTSIVGHWHPKRVYDPHHNAL